MNHRLLPILALGLAVARAASSQDATKTTPREERPLARVMEVSGKGARVWSDGEWTELKPGDEVSAGERVEARKALVDLLLLDDLDARPGAGPRVALGKKARLTLGATEDGIEVGPEEGAVLALGETPLRVRAGRNLIKVQGQAEIERTPRGDVHIDLHFGLVAIEINGKERVLEPGKRVRVGSDGSWGKVKKGSRRAPKWARGGPTLFIPKGRSVVEIDLDAVQDKKKPGVLLKPGTHVSSLEFFVGRAGRPMTFELAEITVYVPALAK